MIENQCNENYKQDRHGHNSQCLLASISAPNDSVDTPKIVRFARNKDSSESSHLVGSVACIELAEMTKRLPTK